MGSQKRGILKLANNNARESVIFMSGSKGRRMEKHHVMRKMKVFCSQKMCNFRVVNADLIFPDHVHAGVVEGGEIRQGFKVEKKKAEKGYLHACVFLAFPPFFHFVVRLEGDCVGDVTLSDQGLYAREIGALSLEGFVIKGY